MDVYYFVIVVTFLICYSYRVRTGDQKDYLKKLIWVFLPVFIFGALREDFGIDYPYYMYEYYLIHGHPENIDEFTIHSELGYQWLEVIMPSWRSLVMLVSSMVVLAFVFLYYKYVEPKMIFFAVFFTFLYPDQSFFLNFVTMRNGLVIAIFWLCVPLIIKRKYLYAFAIAFGLFYLHKSAIIFMTMAILIGQNFRISYKEVTLWVIVLVVLALIPTSVLIERVLPFMGSDEFESYRTHYMKDSGHSLWLYRITCAIFIYWIFNWAIRNRKVLTPAQNVIWRFAMLYLICPFLGPIGTSRMNYYFFPFYVITLSYMAKDQWPNKIEKTFFVCFAIAIMFYTTFVLWINNSRFPYAHYHSILGEIVF